MKKNALYSFIFILLINHFSFGLSIDSTQLYKNVAEFQFEQSKYNGAKTSVLLSISYKKRNDLDSLGNDYSLLSKIYKRQGEYDSALIYLDSAEVFYNKHPNQVDQYALTLLNKAKLFKKKNKPIDAIDYLKKSLIIFNQLNDTLNIANVELNYGNVLKKIKKFNLAKQYYYNALNKFRLLSNNERIADCYNNLGNLYNKLEQIDSAKFYFIQSINYRKENLLYKSFSYHNLANLYVKTQQYDSALFYINHSLNIKYSVNNNKEINSDYITLGEIYYHLKDMKDLKI